MKQTAKEVEAIRYQKTVRYRVGWGIISEMRINVDLPRDLSAGRKVGGEFQNVSPSPPVSTWRRMCLVRKLVR
jgi:hypothetical protein